MLITINFGDSDNFGWVEKLITILITVIGALLGHFLTINSQKGKLYIILNKFCGFTSVSDKVGQVLRTRVLITNKPMAFLIDLDVHNSSSFHKVIRNPRLRIITLNKEAKIVKMILDKPINLQPKIVENIKLYSEEIEYFASYESFTYFLIYYDEKYKERSMKLNLFKWEGTIEDNFGKSIT